MKNWLLKILLFVFAFSMIVHAFPKASTEASLDQSDIEIVFYSSYNYQTITPSRLDNMTKDFFLPTSLDGISVTYDIHSDHIQLSETSETISLRKLDGYEDVEVYRASIVKEPSIWRQKAPFTIDIHVLDDTITLSGQVTMTMPDGFLLGTLFTIIKYGQMFLEGAIKTMILALVGTLAGFLMALVLATLKLLEPTDQDTRFSRLIKTFMNGFASTYITIFRGTPMIVQASFFWYGFALFGNPFYCGLFVVSINTAAYIAEIIRGGIQSVDEGQTEASYALGMTHVQTMVYVVIPQAIKNSLPAIGNEFIVNIKDTAVLSVIGIFELFNQGRKITGMHYRQLEVYLIVALIYLILTYGISTILKHVESRMGLQPLEITSSN